MFLDAGYTVAVLSNYGGGAEPVSLTPLERIHARSLSTPNGSIASCERQARRPFSWSPARLLNKDKSIASMICFR